MQQSTSAKNTLILASGSPRRRELVALVGWQVEVLPVDVDETELPGEDGLSLACRLAELKALAAVERATNHSLILAADTVVVAEGRILGKPDSVEAALNMLMTLSGQEHQVHTAIALYDLTTQELQLDVCTTDVPMRTYSITEAETYIRSGSPLDKAGAYGIQDKPFRPVDVARMTGCYANVVGLPLCHIVRSMRAFGREPVTDVPSRCQVHTGYDCEVYPQILKDKT